MRSISILFTLSALSTSVACKKDKKAEAPTPAERAAPAPAGTAAPTPSANKLTCDKVFPKALQDKYFAGATIADNPQPIASAGECKITAADKTQPESSVAVTCNPNMAAAMEASIKGVKANMKEAKDLAGVGKAAVTMEVADMATMVQAWDDDSDCMTTIMVPKKIDAIAFAKDVLAALPPK